MTTFTSHAVARWDHVACDLMYVTACLSWLEQARTPWYRAFDREHVEVGLEPPYSLPRLVQLEMPPDARRPGLGEVVRTSTQLTKLTANSRSFEIQGWVSLHDEPDVVIAKTRVVRVFAQKPTRLEIIAQHLVPAPAFSPEPAVVWPTIPTSGTRSTRALIRPSDLDAVNHVNNLVYVALFDDALEPHVDKRPTRRIDIEYIREIKLESQVEVVSWWVEPGVHAMQVARDVNNPSSIFARCARWFRLHGDVDVRYLKGRMVPRSRFLPRITDVLVHEMGKPVPASLAVSWEEVSLSSEFAAATLVWTDAAGQVVWDILGRFVVKNEWSATMQRSALVRVFRRPNVGTRMRALAWVSHVGTSSFEMAVDMLDASDGSPLVSARVRKVRTDKTGKAAPVNFDTNKARERFGAVTSPFPPLPPGTPDVKPLARPGGNVHISSASYPLKLRHSDQDQNAHVNSAVYLCLVHDARSFAIAQRAYGDVGNALAAREDWIVAYHIEYMGENKLAEHDVRVLTWFDGARFWFEFLARPLARPDAAEERVTTRVWVEPPPSHLALTEGTLRGFSPFPYNLPGFNTYEPPYEGVDPTPWGSLTAPLPPRSRATVVLSSSSTTPPTTTRAAANHGRPSAHGQEQDEKARASL